MRTIELSYPHTIKQETLPETVCAIGFFDGIHKAHQQVIGTAVAAAESKGMESAVITFHPHPSAVLQKTKQHVKYITPLQEKQKILQQMNVDRLYIIRFNETLAALSPQEFIDHFIIGLHIKHLVAGFDFSYGHKGQGNMKLIASQTRGEFTYETIDKLTSGNEKISSTKIRELLGTGAVGKVNQLLGRPFTVTGTVIHGDKRGREIGFPTANLRINSEAMLPKTGVYAVKAVYLGTHYEGMASLGTNPTFTPDLEQPRVEVNIFDFDKEIYGETLQVEWYQFIRDEEKFDQVDALIKQIDDDEKNIRSYFATNGDQRIDL